jgi:flagellar biosynthesis protein FliQ
MDDLWRTRVRWIGFLAVPAAAALILVVGLFLLQAVASAEGRSLGALPKVLFPTAVWLFVPEMIWLSLVPFLHWSERYQGRHKMLWLCLLVFETGGIFKLIYLFRHILPDWRERGRYRRAPAAPPDLAEEAGTPI